MWGFWRRWQSPLYTRSIQEYQRCKGHIWTGFLKKRSCYLISSLVKPPVGDIPNFHLCLLFWLKNFISYWYLQLFDSSVKFLVSGDLLLWEKYTTRKFLWKVGERIRNCAWRFINDVNIELFDAIWSCQYGVSWMGSIQPLAGCMAWSYWGILGFTLVHGIFLLFVTSILAISSYHILKISLSKWFAFFSNVLRNWTIHIICMVPEKMGSPFPFLPTSNTWAALLHPDMLSMWRSGWPIAVCGVDPC